MATQNRLFYVDAFTSRTDSSLRGNPAGVLITNTPLEDAQAESLARKLGFPALAVLSDPSLFSSSASLSKSDILPIGWLGPHGHWLPLCGHATMAASLVLFSLHPDSEVNEIRYVSRLGASILARKTEHGAEIDFPAAQKHTGLTLSSEDEVLDILGRAAGVKKDDIVWMGENPSNQPGLSNLFIELASSVDLKALHVEPSTFLDLPHRGIWVSTPGKDGYDMETRVFFPRMGILEDQVCGSAHAFFGPYWAYKRRLTIKPGEKYVSMVSRQVSPSGGQVGLRWDGKWKEDNGRCWLVGEGKICDRGSIEL